MGFWSEPAMTAAQRERLNELLVSRARLGLIGIIGGLALFSLADRTLMPEIPTWLTALSAIALVMVALFWIWLGRLAVRANPVPHLLGGIVLVCALRALAGIWQQELAPTAMLLTTVALATSATLPWGVRPQLATVAIVAAAIAANAIALPTRAESVHLGGAVLTALLLSLVVAAELTRHQRRLAREALQREQAESDLARLNADLERRVAERTAALEAASARLEREARERVQTAEALQGSQAKLAALIDHTTDAIWSVDRDQQITVMNAVARERFRQRYGGELSPETRARVTPELAGEFHDLYRRALAGEHIQIERWYDEPDGSRRHYLTTVHPITEGDAITGATVFSKDVTERKRADDQMRAHQAELAHVLRLGTMGEMAAGLAHEINQPLGAIANYAQGTVRRLRAGGTDVAAVLPIVEAIAVEALRAGDIIRRMRDLVRKDTPPQAEIDLAGLVRDSARFIDADARDHDIAVALDLDPTLPTVVGNAIQIEQVILNLLLNGVEALRASPNGERCLTVSAGTIGDDLVEVAVHDTGIGLPDADVFAPYYSTKPDGLGMGLSISHSIIEAHGGELTAVRNPDRGSTFRFTLPLTAT